MWSLFSNSLPVLSENGVLLINGVETRVCLAAHNQKKRTIRRFQYVSIMTGKHRPDFRIMCAYCIIAALRVARSVTEVCAANREKQESYGTEMFPVLHIMGRSLTCHAFVAHAQKSRNLVWQRVMKPCAMHGSVAQLVEQRPFKPLAAGSSPARPTKNFIPLRRTRYLRRILSPPKGPPDPPKLSTRLRHIKKPAIVPEPTEGPARPQYRQNIKFML
jgi:hypothetical protein